MPEASEDDVRVEIDTTLDAGDIARILARIEREWQRVYDAEEFDGTQHIADFEASLAALRIAEGRDRRAERTSSGRASVSYETSEVDSLEKRVRRLDPGDEFGRSASLTIDRDRYTGATDT